MIKKVILAILLALPLSVFAQGKFGVVDLQTVMSAMPEYTAMEQEMASASKQFEDEFTKLREQADKLYADFQTLANDPQTADAIKERRMQEVYESQEKIERFRNTAQQELARKSEQLSAPIQAKMLEAIRTVGTEGGYTFIFPNEQGLLLYTGSNVENVTDKVKARLGL